MLRPPWIRVLFLLACLVRPVPAAQPFEPLAVPLDLPASLRGKAIWSLARLPDGRLAVGFEGGAALGVPGGDWNIVGTPNGGPVQVIDAAHGRVLAAGGGFAGFVEGGAFAAAPGLEALCTEAAAVPEGWLLAGSAGLWLLHPDGSSRVLAAHERASGQPTLARIGNDTLVLHPAQPPLRWAHGELSPYVANTPSAPARTHLLRDGLWFTDDGVLDTALRPVLPPAVTITLLDEAGFVTAAHGTPWTICATYWKGMQAYAAGEGSPAWGWTGYGSLYCMIRDSGQYLAGSERGALAFADPNRVRVAWLDNVEILHLEAESGGAHLVTLHGPREVGTVAPAAADSLWPVTGEAAAAAGTLRFRATTTQLPTRFLNGLSVCGDTAAVAFGNVVLLAGPAEPATFEFSSGITSLATDGRSFFAGTHAGGVKRIDPVGRRTDQLGTGRAKAREIAPGSVLLLGWDGEIRDSRFNLLGRAPACNPRDAALVDITRADGATAPAQLAILATRPDAAPIVAWLDGATWRPLDIPGLAEIQAESMAASRDFLYIAGRLGVLEVRLPLSPAAPPRALWSRLGRPAAGYVQLPDENSGQASLTPGRWEAPPTAPSVYHVILPGGDRVEARGGVPIAVPLHWGDNTFVLKVERNGLAHQRTLTVRRSFPLPLRPWALGLEAAALAAAGWGMARWRVRHLLRQKRELEAAVEQRTAQLRKANAAKEEFLASVSHEIRNPLNGVVGICAILQDSPVGPRERNFLQTLSGCADQLRSMLDDVLDFSRIERGEVALAAAPFEVRALVEEATRVMDPLLEACALELPDDPQWLLGDSGKIRQIVCNLVSNALKYGHPREAGVELRVVPELGGRKRMRIAVRNTGPTIPAEELPRLFESFRRGTTTGGAPGFGLGLAVCRRLAERMGGRMTAASADNSTEFALELLLDTAVPPTAAATGAAPPAVSRALAVEDEDYNRLALGHALRSLGFAIDWAPDGAAALELAAHQQYDLILTDWRLPDIDGGELCRRLLAAQPEPKPPVVAVTAYSSAEKQAEARAAGMTGFVTKPVTREKLEHIIRNLAAAQGPRPPLEPPRKASLPASLALLGDLAPTLAKLGVDIDEGWRRAEALARLRDPRAGAAAHALRSLLLLAGDNELAEQLGLLETAATNGDWSSADRLLPFLGEEIAAARARLALE